MSMIDLDLSHYFAGFKAKSKTIGAVVNNAKSVYNMEHSQMLGGQFFNALYQQDPRLQNVADPNNQYAQAIRAVLNSGQFLALRNQTAGSLSWSAIGASILVDELAKKLYWQNIPQPDMPQPSKDSEDGEDENESAENKSGSKGKTETSEEEIPNNESEGNSDGNEDQSDGSESNSDEPTDSKDESDGESNEETKDGDDGSEESDEQEDKDDGSSESESESLDEQLGEPISSVIQEAVKEAGEKLNNMMNGLNAGAGDKEETFNDAIDLADLYTSLATNRGLSSLIELVGKLKLNTSFLPAMHIGEPEEVSEVELGDEIEKTLPSDMGLMFGEDEEFFNFMQKLENKELVQYQTVTHKSPGMGPIVICLDDSGSMSYSMKGSQHTRDQWAKSLAIAIYIQSIKENRPCAIVKFSVMTKLLVPERMGRLDANLIDELQQSYYGGGTNFGLAWDRAIEFITSDFEGKDFRDADIVFITDGDGGFDPSKITADKIDHNIRLVTIFIGEDQSHAMRKPTVAQWSYLSDAMAFVGKLSDTTEAEAFKIIRNHELKGLVNI